MFNANDINCRTIGTDCSNIITSLFTMRWKIGEFFGCTKTIVASHLSHSPGLAPWVTSVFFKITFKPKGCCFDSEECCLVTDPYSIDHGKLSNSGRRKFPTNTKTLLAWNVRTSVALFTPFNFWGRRGRKKRIMDATCCLASLIF